MRFGKGHRDSQEGEREPHSKASSGKVCVLRQIRKGGRWGWAVPNTKEEEDTERVFMNHEKRHLDLKQVKWPGAKLWASVKGDSCISLRIDSRKWSYRMTVFYYDRVWEPWRNTELGMSQGVYCFWQLRDRNPSSHCSAVRLTKRPRQWGWWRQLHARDGSMKV